MLAQLIVGGLATGSCYALIALALSIVYKTSDVLNFAQGEMAMISTFVALALLEGAGAPFAVACAGTLVFAAVLGAATEFLFLRRAKNPTTLGLVIMTLGFEMILYGFAGWKWGSDPRTLALPISDATVYHAGPVVVSQLNVAMFAVSLLLMALLFAFFRFTRLGIAMKATAQNPEAARIMGIPSGRVLSFTWALSSVIGAVAGMLMAPLVMLDPNMMLDPLMKGFAAAVLGGMTSLPGAAAGAFMLGVIESLFGGYVSTEFKSVVAFAIIVLVLCVRPSGLFARHYIRRV
ncbi:MAG: branched-chain amino acid ABC transporter permease [Deltaproteobacteria bacterium]|nr:branched-chain amino acid ABC transporter permease [Deltaproteobacteria bacterium]